jgi:hypothetical protein
MLLATPANGLGCRPSSAAQASSYALRNMPILDRGSWILLIPLFVFPHRAPSSDTRYQHSGCSAMRDRVSTYILCTKRCCAKHGAHVHLWFARSLLWLCCLAVAASAYKVLDDASLSSLLSTPAAPEAPAAAPVAPAAVDVIATPAAVEVIAAPAAGKHQWC